MVINEASAVILIELQQEWANGAWLLVPATQEQLEEACLNTCGHHILVRKQDEGTVNLC